MRFFYSNPFSLLVWAVAAKKKIQKSDFIIQKMRANFENSGRLQIWTKWRKLGCSTQTSTQLPQSVLPPALPYSPVVFHSGRQMWKLHRVRINRQKSKGSGTLEAKCRTFIIIRLFFTKFICVYVLFFLGMDFIRTLILGGMHTRLR